MFEVITSQKVQAAIMLGLKRQVTKRMGLPRKVQWAFPSGGRDELPTWFHRNVLGRPLVVAIGPDNSWETRTPVFLARSEAQPTLTPAVEVNIPDGIGKVNRSVAGCLCRTHDEHAVIAHRGTSFAVSGGKITKNIIHRHFDKWLVSAQDGDRVTQVIPVAPIDADLLLRLAQFVDEVISLKELWKASRGLEATRPPNHWREDIRFPGTIARAVEASSASFEYKHGPLQALLQNSLNGYLGASGRTVLNQHLDLAVLVGDSVAAIFEVKTDLGPQLYSGIGQLFWYRQMFARPDVPLFLVLPASSRPNRQVIETGIRLERLGVTLLIERDGILKTWDRKPLRTALVKAGIV